MHNSHLSAVEIEEELINNDLLNTGGVEDDAHLEEMNMEEKRNLLRGIEQSKEDFSSKINSESSTEPSSLDISNFPSLSSAGKSNHGSRNKLKLPRKSTKTYDSDNSLDKCISLSDYEEDTFCLPFYINDDAPPLPIPEKLIKRSKNPYFVIANENPFAAVKRMLAHHDKWKALYKEEMRKIELNDHGEDIREDTNITNDKDLLIKNKSEEKENDPYRLIPSPPMSSSKGYNFSRKRDTDILGSTGQPASRQLQRKTSRDSDCEEVEANLKPDQHQLSEWMPTTTSRHKPKRNKKQLINQDKDKCSGESPEVEFEFDNKWDSQSASWDRGQSPSTSILNNQSQTRRMTTHNPVVEEKVECPLCQQYFASSKIETHAATCEGFSDLPMDVEEEN